MGITLDEAIIHAEVVSEENQRVVDTGILFDDVTIDMLYCDDTEVIEEHLANYQECAEEHRQLAEWLKDYKRLKEQEPCEDVISREQVKSDYADWFGYGYEDNWFYRHLSNIQPFNPQQKKEHWIHRELDNECWEECSECHVERAYPTLYCPDCGTRMVEPQESEE